MINLLTTVSRETFPHRKSESFLRLGEESLQLDRSALYLILTPFCSLPDAEPAENVVEHILDIDPPRHLPERMSCRAQIFSPQLRRIE